MDGLTRWKSNVTFNITRRVDTQTGFLKAPDETKTHERPFCTAQIAYKQLTIVETAWRNANKTYVDVHVYLPFLKIRKLKFESWHCCKTRGKSKLNKPIWPWYSSILSLNPSFSLPIKSHHCIIVQRHRMCVICNQLLDLRNKSSVVKNALRTTLTFIQRS